MSASGPTHRHRRPPKASDILIDLLSREAHPQIAIGDLIGSLDDRAFGIVLLLFALPNCFPIPPGLASVIGLPLVFFGIQLAVGSRHPWLPGFIARRRIQRSSLLHLVQRAQPVLHRMETVLRPRWMAVTGLRAERVLGLAISMFGLSVGIPVPFTNFIPAVGVAVISLGLLTKDGVAVVIGLLIGLTGIAVTSSVLLSLGFLTAWIVA